VDLISKVSKTAPPKQIKPLEYKEEERPQASLSTMKYEIMEVI
jgi:hypothetical protein